MSQLVKKQENSHWETDWKTLSGTYHKYSLQDVKHIMYLHSYHNTDLRNKYETPWTFSSK